MVRIALVPVLAFLLAMQIASPARAGMDEAWAAFERGDHAAALAEFRRLADAGNGRAQLRVALAYLNGYGVAPDAALAARWFERAAEQGVGIAQYTLGRFYAEGRGVVQSDARAYAWYEIAIWNGYPCEREFRDQVARSLSADEIAGAKAWAAAWLAAHGQD